MSQSACCSSRNRDPSGSALSSWPELQVRGHSQVEGGSRNHKPEVKGRWSRACCRISTGFTGSVNSCVSSAEPHLLKEPSRHQSHQTSQTSLGQRPVWIRTSLDQRPVCCLLSWCLTVQMSDCFRWGHEDGDSSRSGVSAGVLVGSRVYPASEGTRHPPPHRLWPQVCPRRQRWPPKQRHVSHN